MMNLETLLSMSDQATRTSQSLIGQMPPEVWQLEPKGSMGAGEIVVHLIQVNKFNGMWIGDRSLATVTEPFGLKEPFDRVAHSKDKLRKLNLEAARSTRRDFGSLDSLKGSYAVNRERVRQALMQIPADRYSLELCHPLVELDVTRLDLVCIELFVRYSDYCSALIAQQLITAGFSERVPFPFARF